MSLKKKINDAIERIEDIVNNDVAQLENSAEGEKIIFPNMPEVCLKAAQEAQVLLKNNGILPLSQGDKLAVFGRCQVNYFYVGYGSGGDVNAPYFANILDSLRTNGISLDEELVDIYEKWCEANPINHGIWGHWPMCYPEMPIEKSVVDSVRKRCDTALVIIGRAAGEDRENTLEKGSFYLTDIETDLLDTVTAAFEKVVVVLDCGNIIDMAWTEKYGDKLSAIIYSWQCGMESGNALADVLTGKVSPCGKLSDAIARNFEDYPSSRNFGCKNRNNYSEDVFLGYRYFESFDKDKVLYPFGFGLSYTEFEMKATAAESDENGVKIQVQVTNTGSAAGKEVVQLYISKPQAELCSPTVALVAFAKTDCLAPGDSQTIELYVSAYDMCCFDDEGVTGYKNAYVLLGGEYVFMLGNSSRNIEPVYSVTYEKRLYQQLQEVCGVKNPFDRIIGRYVDSKLFPIKKAVKPCEPYLRNRIIENLPEGIGFKGYKGRNFDSVKSGDTTLDEFIAQLDNDELEALTRGQGTMDSDLGVAGNAGAFCGIIPSLRDKGVPPIITTDGPAGIRIKAYTSLLPCGTALACTWNTTVVEELAEVVGKEMKHHKTDILLGPGMNIHRNALCGRNFEYFSEDPLVSGKIAAAFVRGIQSQGVGACPKHFACNNQEFNRTHNDSRVSQRALREIYLKGFEICVKESAPYCIMTSYNKINGVWSHYNYDLVTTVLRGEWGYEGAVMTDWWMRKSKSPEFPSIRDNAYRVRSQVDVLMPGKIVRDEVNKRYKVDPSLLKDIDTDSGITRAELERTAKTVLTLALKLDK